MLRRLVVVVVVDEEEEEEVVEGEREGVTAEKRDRCVEGIFLIVVVVMVLRIENFLGRRVSLLRLRV